MDKMKDKSYLVPIYDTKKSFYDKAYVVRIENIIRLYSYNTLVLEVGRDYYKLNKSINEKLLFSNTTLRHIKETLKQFYYKYDKTLTKKRNNKRKFIKWIFFFSCFNSLDSDYNIIRH